MNRKSGQTLIVATVLFIFLVIVLGEAVLLYMRNQHRLNVKQITLTDDFYLAQAGIERAQYKLKVDGDYSGETYDKLDPKKPIIITKVSQPQANQFVFRAKVTQSKSGGELSILREIEVLFERTEEIIDEKIARSVVVREWHEILPISESSPVNYPRQASPIE